MPAIDKLSTKYNKKKFKKKNGEKSDSKTAFQTTIKLFRWIMHNNSSVHWWLCTRHCNTFVMCVTWLTFIVIWKSKFCYHRNVTLFSWVCNNFLIRRCLSHSVPFSIKALRHWIVYRQKPLSTIWVMEISEFSKLQNRELGEPTELKCYATLPFCWIYRITYDVWRMREHGKCERFHFKYNMGCFSSFDYYYYCIICVFVHALVTRWKNAKNQKVKSNIKPDRIVLNVRCHIVLLCIKSMFTENTYSLRSLGFHGKIHRDFQ